MTLRDDLATLIANVDGEAEPVGIDYDIADAITAKYRLTLIPPPPPPHIPPELARDTGGHQCDARDEDHSITCQRPVNHPGRHYAQDADGYIQFLTAREVDELRQATQR